MKGVNMAPDDRSACMQEKVGLQDSQIDAVEAFVRTRTAPRTAAHEARAVFYGAQKDAAASEKEASCSSIASGVTLPSDRGCDAMRSRLALVVAQHSAASAAGIDVGPSFTL